MGKGTETLVVLLRDVNYMIMIRLLSPPAAHVSMFAVLLLGNWLIKSAISSESLVNL